AAEPDTWARHGYALALREADRAGAGSGCADSAVPNGLRGQADRRPVVVVEGVRRSRDGGRPRPEAHRTAQPARDRAVSAPLRRNARLARPARDGTADPSGGRGRASRPGRSDDARGFAFALFRRGGELRP